MNSFFGKQLPIAVTFFAGIVMIVTFFSGNSAISDFSQSQLVWVTIVGGFALLLGVVSITKVSLDHVRQRKKDWPYKVVLLVFLAISSVGAIFEGTEQGTVYDWLFQNMNSPMMSTMFSLLAFYIASAAYRAFRARTLEATILLITATVVMLGRVPMGRLIYEYLPQITDWIMNYPNLSVQRGIIIGAALGAASMSLRIILGIERTYLGRS
ncbi:MAG: hypothetical protein KKG33_02195 [candidate division Zixibacteria bacterium]|nr:hypothetical protein [candidate division Zixibacteria bacterium]MBU1470512.1 hypothetical protein [candidate division Zixibacteria bacterium]MBU2624352.1 hypothetical protein [candidate division Zixibacteria bacterium]